MISRRIPRVNISKACTRPSFPSAQQRGITGSMYTTSKREACFTINYTFASQHSRTYSSQSKANTTTISKPILSPSKKQLDRLAFIIRVVGAFRTALGKDHDLAKLSEKERNDFLWSLKDAVKKEIPLISFPDAYPIIRRLIEVGLFPNVSDAEIKSSLFANGGGKLGYTGGIPFQLKSEIDEYMAKDKAKKGSELDTTDAKVEINVQVDETDSNTKDVVSGKVKGGSGDAVLASSKGKVEAVENIKTMENMVAFPEIKKLTPEEESVIPSAFATLSSKLSEEEIETRKFLDKLKVSEDETVKANMEALMRKSRILREENRRPDLKPYFYPNQARYILLSEATTLLEQACFNFVARLWPKVVTLPNFDCPEAQELRSWTSLMRRELGTKKWKSHLPEGFQDGSDKGNVIRNAAAHRLSIDSSKVRALLGDATTWIKSLGDEITAEKALRLEGIAQQMQNDVGDSLKPVVADIMKTLESIGEIRETISTHESKIRELESAIRKEREKIKKQEDKIEEEEKKISLSLKEEHKIRYAQGQALDRDALRQFIHQGLISSDTDKEETVRKENVVTEINDNIEYDGKATEEKVASLKSNIEISEDDLKQMLHSENSKFTEDDKAHLKVDSTGSLVSLSNKTLQDVDEIANLPNDAETVTSLDPREQKYQKSASIDDIKLSQETNKLASKKADFKYEGNNLSRESSADTSETKRNWYNPLSWWR